MELNLIQQVAVWVIPVLFAITIHEVAHGWVAKLLGDPTAMLLGRLTVNHTKHVDLVGTLIVPAIALLISGFVFGWAKPVPTNPMRYTRTISMRNGLMIVALAGPLSNLFLAILSAFALVVVNHLLGPIDTALKNLMWMMFTINISLFIFNMLPVYPLDGQKVLAGLLRGRAAENFERFNMQYGSILLIGLVFFAHSILAAPFAYISKGKNYLNPKLELLVDEAIDLDSKEKLKINLEKKLYTLISSELSDLVNLSNAKIKNNYARALCYQLFENNGVIKRNTIHQMIKNISKEDRISSVSYTHLTLPTNREV